MSTFDPAAATAAYLAQLSPAQHAKAIAYTQGGHWLLLWNWLASVVAAWLILRSGVLAALSARLQRRRRRPLLASLAVAAVFMLASAVLTLPWAVYADWAREKAYGLTSQPLAGFLGESVLNTVISTVIAALFLMGLYALIRRAPRWWWAWGGALATVGLVLVMIVSPIFIEPLFNTYTPAPPGAVRDTVVALAKESGVPSDKIYIYNGSRQSNRYTANVSGLFGSARVAMSDTMFAKGADVAEVRGVVGHEMGHYAHGHVLWAAAVLSVLAASLFWLTDRLYPWARRLMGAQVRDISDPAGLPVVMIVLSTLILLATPLLNTLTRMQEADADAFSLAHAHEPDGFAKAMVKTIEYRADSPGRVEEVLFYDHPSVSRRIRRAMDWKAAHMGAAAPSTMPSPR